MSNIKVTEGQTSFQNVPIPDSGAKISQHIKEVDRNQKFKLFECLQALVKGRLPTNEQIDHMLVMAQNSRSLEAREHMLSADGRSLFKDFRELMRTTRGIVYEKNEQELFQNFIYHCTQASESASKTLHTPDLDIGVSTRKAEREGKETLESLVSVAKLVTTNSEFRSILDELFHLAKEVFSEGAQKVSQTAASVVNSTANSGGGYQNSAVSATQEGGQKIQEGIIRAAGAVQEVADQAQQDPMVAAQGARQNLGQQKDATIDSVRTQAHEMKSKLYKRSEGLMDQAHSQALHTKEDAIHYADSKMPAEKRQQLLERLKIVIGQIQGDKQYQKAIDSVLGLIETWRKRAERPAENITAEAGKVFHDPNVEAATVEFKIILQRWAQGHSLDPMIDTIHQLWQKTNHDPELDQYMDNVGQFMGKAVREPNYITSEVIDKDAEALMDQGNKLLSRKYKPYTDKLLEEGEIFVHKLNTDPRSKEVADSFHQFSSHLFYDKHSKLAFKPHLFDDFRYVLMPALMESFQFIPIPRIEYSDLKVDLVLDNIILTSTDLLPRFFEFGMHNTMRMVPRGNANHSLDENEHDFNLIIQGVEASVRNVDYYIKTKDGLRFEDRGIADVLINKKGIDVKVKGSKTPEDSEIPSMITIEDVKVKVHALTIKMRKSKHPILYAFAQPFVKTVIKNSIARALEAQIKEALVSGDKAVATSIRDTRIKTGKNTFGALMESATSFVSNKISPDEETKAKNERKKNQGNYNRTSRVLFDENGLCVLDPVKHIELKVGQPLLEDPNAMAAMSVHAPWVSTAFDMREGMEIQGRNQLPGMRRTQGMAM
ncbi:hypothetical protein BGW38_009326 [Lunasporangiospora selenospora]|uniref:Uncharacterized protein n=1 Tax=Lunasporangiospora selenospora TaxID=979761 RepID=A0A9P6FXY2_9FUNG|nr:hypothetical protein BGW38_009326 [Lunasporangiospora selenospora]